VRNVVRLAALLRNTVSQRISHTGRAQLLSLSHLVALAAYGFARAKSTSTIGPPIGEFASVA
jgi:hypothetical protein